MNVDIERYLRGIERSARMLPRVVDRWSETEAELREEYSRQLIWTLRARRALSLRARSEGLGFAFSTRVGTAMTSLLAYLPWLSENMGIDAQMFMDDVGLGDGAEFVVPSGSDRACDECDLPLAA